jgi:uncharacterized membrane protein YbhN (UPF0104 family)
MSRSFVDRFFEAIGRAGRNRWLATTLKLLIVICVLWFIRSFIADAWTKLSEHQFHVHLGWLVLAGGLYLVGTLPYALFWQQSLRALGQHVPLAETIRAYYLGHLGKHVPGKAMVVVIRAGLIRRPGVDGALAVASVFLETLTMMSVGALLAGVIVAVWLRDHRSIALAAAALAAAAGLPTLPPVFRRLVRLAGFRWISPAAKQKLDRLGWKTMGAGWLLSAIGWAVLGVSYWAVLEGLGLAHDGLVGRFYVYVASVSFATVSGFVSMVPGGIAVREGALTKLTTLMIPSIGGGMALLSTILLRFVWFVSELAISAMLYGGRWCRGKGPRTNDGATGSDRD